MTNPPVKPAPHGLMRQKHLKQTVPKEVKTGGTASSVQNSVDGMTARTSTHGDTRIQQGKKNYKRQRTTWQRVQRLPENGDGHVVVGEGF